MGIHQHAVDLRVVGVEPDGLFAGFQRLVEFVLRQLNARLGGQRAEFQVAVGQLGVGQDFLGQRQRRRVVVAVLAGHAGLHDEELREVEAVGIHVLPFR